MDHIFSSSSKIKDENTRYYLSGGYAMVILLNYKNIPIGFG